MRTVQGEKNLEGSIFQQKKREKEIGINRKRGEQYW